jgi:hypothetical protein
MAGPPHDKPAPVGPEDTARRYRVVDPLEYFGALLLRLRREHRARRSN